MKKLRKTLFALTLALLMILPVFAGVAASAEDDPLVTLPMPEDRQMLGGMVPVVIDKIPILRAEAIRRALSIVQGRVIKSTDRLGLLRDKAEDFIRVELPKFEGAVEERVDRAAQQAKEIGAGLKEKIGDLRADIGGAVNSVVRVVKPAVVEMKTRLTYMSEQAGAVVVRKANDVRESVGSGNTIDFGMLRLLLEILFAPVEDR